MNPILLLSQLIEFGGALVVLWFAARAATALTLGRASDAALTRARRLLADGVVAALGLITAATLLESTQLRTWNAIGLFAAVLALRTAVKQAQAWELSRAQPSRERAAR